MKPSTSILRERLHQYIDHIEDYKIEAFYTLLKSDMAEEIDEYMPTDEQINEAERRTKSYLAGETKAYSWEEAKKMIRPAS